MNSRGKKKVLKAMGAVNSINITIELRIECKKTEFKAVSNKEREILSQAKVISINK